MDNSELIRKSLEDNDIGYSGVLKDEEVFQPTHSIYEIPLRYFIDSLTLMTINPHNSYLYWEVTDETLEKFGISPTNVHLSISLYDENEAEVFSFESVFSVGSYYLKHGTKNKWLTAKLHLKFEDKDPIALLSSNRVKLFDPTLKASQTSPLYGEYGFADEVILDGEGKIVNLNSISLLNNTNASSSSRVHQKETK